MSTPAPQAYPLQWPPGKPRTQPGRRVRGRFKRTEHVVRTIGEGPNAHSYGYRESRGLTVAVAIQRLQRELDRLVGARLPVISSNLELRLDGLPRSGQRKPDDPGVAVYFRLDGDPVVLACDHYQDVEDNIAAIAAHVEASRAIERHGVGTLREIFRGFAALPPGIAPADWRSALGNPRTLDEAEAVYRERMKSAHPDVGGSHAEAAALNAAIELARAALS